MDWAAVLEKAGLPVMIVGACAYFFKQSLFPWMTASIDKAHAALAAERERCHEAFTQQGKDFLQSLAVRDAAFDKVIEALTDVKVTVSRHVH